MFIYYSGGNAWSSGGHSTPEWLLPHPIVMTAFGAQTDVTGKLLGRAKEFYAMEPGAVTSHFLDSGAFTLKTKCVEWAKERGVSWRDFYDSDEFYKYCVTLDTKVLTSDLRWVDAGSIRPGDELLGFDEYPLPPLRGRNWRRATVLSYKEIVLPCYRLVFDDGTTVTCSGDHKWLSASSTGRANWIYTHAMHVGGKRASSVVKPIDVWEGSRGWEFGYLSAAFDGEGCLSRQVNPKHHGRGTLHLSFSQQKNSMRSQVINLLHQLGFTFSDSGMSLYISGGCRETLRFLGLIRPERLLGKFRPEMLGRMTLDRRKRVRLMKREYIGERPVASISTDTGTFLANGLASHNCDDYAAFIKQYRVAIDLFANVDVIGDPVLTYRNQKYLEEKHGLRPVPVVHYPSSMEWLDRYVSEGYELVGLGGLVRRDAVVTRRDWLDRCFDHICDPVTRLPTVKIHGFGVTSYPMLIRYPWWSVDSVTWAKTGAFGGILVPHKRDGKFTFEEEPYQITMSYGSPGEGHYWGMSPAEQAVVLEWLAMIEVPLGKVDNGEVVELGVLTRHTERRLANLRFFEKLIEWLPPWPWPFKCAKRSVGFGLI